MTERKSYSLADLVAQCDPDAPIPNTLREWKRMVPIGMELVITRHAVDVVPLCQPSCPVGDFA